MIFDVSSFSSSDRLSLEELQRISDKFEADIYDAVSLKTCVEKRLTIGGPGPEAMKAVIEKHKAYLAEESMEDYRSGRLAESCGSESGCGQ